MISETDYTLRQQQQQESSSLVAAPRPSSSTSSSSSSTTLPQLLRKDWTDSGSGISSDKPRRHQALQVIFFYFPLFFQPQCGRLCLSAAAAALVSALSAALCQWLIFGEHTMLPLPSKRHIFKRKCRTTAHENTLTAEAVVAAEAEEVEVEVDVVEVKVLMMMMVMMKGKKRRRRRRKSRRHGNDENEEK
ncbi:MAG: hypothetical protein QWI73_06460 [Alphaproteobacteria bacterium]|nr:hypothetical protein [Alphaproteobacteria bacterium]